MDTPGLTKQPGQRREGAGGRPHGRARAGPEAALQGQGSDGWVLNER